LTIKSISNTKYSMSFFLRAASPLAETCGVVSWRPLGHPLLGSLQILVVSIARQIFNFQRSDFFGYCWSEDAKNQDSGNRNNSPSVSSLYGGPG